MVIAFWNCSLVETVNLTVPPRLSLKGEDSEREILERILEARLRNQRGLRQRRFGAGSKVHGPTRKREAKRMIQANVTNKREAPFFELLDTCASSISAFIAFIL